MSKKIKPLRRVIASNRQPREVQPTADVVDREDECDRMASHLFVVGALSKKTPAWHPEAERLVLLARDQLTTHSAFALTAHMDRCESCHARFETIVNDLERHRGRQQASQTIPKQFAQGSLFDMEADLSLAFDVTVS